MSVRKNVLSWGLVVLVLGLIAAAAYYVMAPQLRPHVTIRLGDGVFLAQVAKTQETREKGLSNTPGLRPEEAMLFVYGSDDKWPIWMKDMNYPIDIIWLDKDKKVVYIVKNAPPESYPYENFTPKQEARYVVEVAAGTVGSKSISIGTIASFDENNIEGWNL
ncbi:MAG TPA: DUF192 domain-containing protein [Candidatus Saccharimonadales bacterium]|nr:DUF192 domain-containing protein [Candidatus Saccharimonadales bacterium]